MSKAFTLEQKFEVWDDDSGECIEVGPDRDGLELVELRLKNSDGKIIARVTMAHQQAALVAEAIRLSVKVPA